MPVHRRSWRDDRHCVASFLPVPRVAGCGLGRPRARARMLLCPRPDRAIRAGAPRCSPPSHKTLGRSHRHPGAAHPSGARGRRSQWPPAAPADQRHPPPTSRKSCSRTKGLARPRADGRIAAWRGGWWPRPPSGRRPMVPERAGPERPERRVETPAPTERFVRGRGTARLRPLIWPTRSHALAGRRAARWRRPSDTAAACGAKQNSLTQ
jgi:hypothetical protein